MIIREAIIDDLGQIFDIRFSVKENVLSNRDLVTEADCINYLTRRGKGWVCDMAFYLVLPLLTCRIIVFGLCFLGLNLKSMVLGLHYTKQ